MLSRYLFNSLPVSIQGCIFLCVLPPPGGGRTHKNIQRYELLRVGGKNDYKAKQKKGKGEKRKGKGKKGKKKKEKEKKEKGKGKEKGGKGRKKMVFGSHRKISKTFLGKKIIFFPRGKEYHIFSSCDVFKIWSKMLYV